MTSTAPPSADTVPSLDRFSCSRIVCRCTRLPAPLACTPPGHFACGHPSVFSLSSMCTLLRVSRLRPLRNSLAGQHTQPDAPPRLGEALADVSPLTDCTQRAVDCVHIQRGRPEGEDGRRRPVAAHVDPAVGELGRPACRVTSLVARLAARRLVQNDSPCNARQHRPIAVSSSLRSSRRAASPDLTAALSV